ncbi:hypothetical protein [Paenarthrobacter nitroguajacolicus]|uniref:hypothetical protein n=1 Tax=Paenarthrobacter nitroguajacolicus TaxID=211146 RepID=UPI0040540B78
MQSPIPFYSSVVSHDWEALGYATQEDAQFWDTRSCGVACLRMAYGYLAPGDKVLPAALTAELLQIGAYTETSGWNHLGLARHARGRGFAAHLLKIPRPDDLWAAVTAPGILIVSISSSFEDANSAGHLAVVVGFAESGAVIVNRPSSQDPFEGQNLQVDSDTFWSHFSGKGIHIGHRTGARP